MLPKRCDSTCNRWSVFSKWPIVSQFSRIICVVPLSRARARARAQASAGTRAPARIGGVNGCSAGCVTEVYAESLGRKDAKEHGNARRVCILASLLSDLHCMPDRRSDAVGELSAEYNTGVEYEYRDAEYECEYKYQGSRRPEPLRTPTSGVRGFANPGSIVHSR
ncbi:hypothetical protein CA85_35720 [Allorhodopirellula solitaria]|uniref:Uncharacterized protein n=1 Tax=Allorhodopirellula solitaria TaxID=2527987 RepID=A0A5C5XNN6_9BACT|nr:hypothetical protein CA85_35720 [Allorhodopirellula solitaria]